MTRPPFVLVLLAGIAVTGAMIADDCMWYDFAETGPPEFQICQGLDDGECPAISADQT